MSDRPLFRSIAFERPAKRGPRPDAEPGLAEQAVAADRRLRPELWAKADRVARIIDPGAFAEAYDSVGPDAEPVPPTTRQRYRRSRALRKAWDVLRELGIAPETTDWAAIFGAMDGEAPGEDAAPGDEAPPGRRREALRELVEEGQRLGLYEDPEGDGGRDR